MSQSKRYIQVPRRLVEVIGTLALGGLLFSAASALADGDNATQTVVGSDLILPYDGYMMVDSAPLTGTRTIKFELFEASAGGSAVWTEEQAVTLYNGRFSVGLGTSSTLTATILDAEKLWLAMTVIDTSSGARVEVGLSGRQAIEPAPFAAWSANSADFNVAGTLTVGEGANITGATTITGAATVTGNSTLTGSESDGATAPLSIKTTGTTQEMLLDGNEIDTLGGELVLQKNSVQAMTVYGAFNTRAATTLGNDSADQTTVNGPLKLEQSLTFADNKDIYGVDIIRGHDDIRLRATASTTSNTMQLTDTAITMNENTTVNGTLHATGNLTTNGSTTLGNASADSTTVNGTLTVTSTVSHTTSCASGNIGSLLKNGNRLCFYRYDDTDDTDYRKAAYQCYNTYGAQICTYNQMTIGRVQGTVSSSEMRESYWMRDIVADDRALRTNNTTSADNFETDSDKSNDLDGAFCCEVISGK